jgi:hypothetical protein
MNNQEYQSSFFSPSARETMIQPQQPQSPTPIITKTQQLATGFINDAKPNSFTNTISPSNIAKKPETVPDMMKIIPSALRNIQPQSYEIAARSVKDIEQRMAELSKYSLGGVIPNKEQTTSNNNVTNNQVTNNTSHTTVITTDYVRNIKADYQTMPTWRAYSG